MYKSVIAIESVSPLSLCHLAILTFGFDGEPFERLVVWRLEYPIMSGKEKDAEPSNCLSLLLELGDNRHSFVPLTMSSDSSEVKLLEPFPTPVGPFRSRSLVGLLSFVLLNPDSIIPSSPGKFKISMFTISKW